MVIGIDIFTKHVLCVQSKRCQLPDQIGHHPVGHTHHVNVIISWQVEPTVTVIVDVGVVSLIKLAANLDRRDLAQIKRHFEDCLGYLSVIELVTDKMEQLIR